MTKRLSGRSFTQLVADNQFSALGLVLIAELARTQKAVGTLHANTRSVPHRSGVVSAVGQQPEAGMLEDIGEVLSRPHDGGNLGNPDADAATIAESRSDAPFVELEGQKVVNEDTTSPPSSTRRSPFGRIPDPRSGSSISLKRTTERKDKAKKKKKQKQGNSNPIDDLFEGMM